ncbi:hypothetical protein CGLO_00115 [Colletotrichum gloeosporioides Cg-14]|uniref:Uncharacterized protein n=1 Tax=Colletotrichum gloeosporioides (strain Cg-14) TaxID=1237896 RepID=T0L4R9_COLGC|nr:hypothetical protein CGLO_00115 [Colletotrichum gloeosporioides Cg-14]
MLVAAFECNWNFDFAALASYIRIFFPIL